MKTTLLKTTVRRALAAVLVSAGGLLLIAAGVQGSGPASSDGEGAFDCTNATIQGTYGIQIEGTRPVPPAAGGGTETVIGVVRRTYDGAGNFTQIDNVKGSVTGITPDRPGAGTYQVNANCTGLTQFEPAPGMVIEERLVIVRRGREMRSITSTPAGVMVTTVAAQIPVPAQVVSRKLHNGTPFDITLPLGGVPGIECRSGGPSNDYQLVFTFAGSVTLNSAAVTEGSGTVSSTSGNGTTTLTVNLTGVGNAQTIAVKLLGVSDGTATADVDVEMGMLLGDTTGSGFVTASDIGETKAQSGQAAGALSFRTDVNANGSINAGDIGLVKSTSGTALP